MCRAFQGWAERVGEKKGRLEQLLGVSQIFMRGSMTCCFKTWHQYTQVSWLIHNAKNSIAAALQLYGTSGSFGLIFYTTTH